MEDAAVFSVLSKCFAPADEGDWKRLTAGAQWSEFLDGARCLLQDEDGFEGARRPLGAVRRRCPLQEFLSAGEVNALFCPPTWAEKRAFAARHFTGGLPESAVPVESLYSVWSCSSKASPFPRAKGLYQSDTARYMRSVVEGLGCSVPEEFAGCPDHLALELDLVSVMLRSGMAREARTLLAERFAWLTAYRMRLLSLEDDARFYVGLVDVLLGIRAQQAEEEPRARLGAVMESV